MQASVHDFVRPAHSGEIRLVLLAASIALTGCGLQDEEGAVAPGIYAVSQLAGSNNTLVVRKDGTYVDMEDNIPQPVDEGAWRYEDGRFCLESAAGAGAQCYTETVKPDGAIVLTADGQTITLTPRS